MRKAEIPELNEWRDCDPGCLLGHTLVGAKIGDDEVIFTLESGEEFRLWHRQDCCETVELEDVAGDISDLVGLPVTMAEEVSGGAPDGHTKDPESETWTFYKFATAKGYVTLRWYGTSNGYYSESVSFCRVK